MTTAPASLHEALRFSRRGDGMVEATIVEGWDVRGNPHGGYLLALVAEAMASVVPQPHPLAIAATYLAPPSFGRAELMVEPVRIGRRQSTASVRLVQNGLERVRATATFGQLSSSEPTFPAGSSPVPQLPEPGDCHPSSALALAEGEPIRLHQSLELRLAPGTGWISDAPSGIAEVTGWLRLANGAPTDTAALLVFSDGMPPSIFEAQGRVGHVPTLQLTTHLFALPGPGWVLGRFRTQVVNGALVGEDGELWDETGKLVATTRQMALLVPAVP
jgi:acyl-CoA thioesterase